MLPTQTPLFFSCGIIHVHQQQQRCPNNGNRCSGNMGKVVIKAADSAGLQILSISFGSEEESGHVVEVCGRSIEIHGPSTREVALATAYNEHPNMIVVAFREVADKPVAGDDAVVGGAGLVASEDFVGEGIRAAAPFPINYPRVAK
ncbi:unnamed protein product [Linum trigynum]|uniref:Uncharacterized protein n=1 Tax=Linum trigynum TaxID=586398 RepID=A0AAV2F8Q2_9ROSI